MEEFIAAATTPAFLITICAFLAMLITAYYVIAPFIEQSDLDTRLSLLAEERERLRQSRSQELSERKSIRQKDAGLFGKIAAQLNLEEHLADNDLEKKLRMAGVRGRSGASYYYVAKLILVVSMSSMAILWVWVLGGLNGWSMNAKMMVLGIAVAIGYYTPSLYLKNLAAKRLKEIMRVFPDSLDMILLCVESGMSVELALSKVSSEIGTSSPALAEELGLTVAELSYLPERRQAYENFALRTGHEGIKSVTTALIQAEKYGTPVGEALRVMAKENRQLRMTAAEKKAASLPSKLTGPMILFFLPVLALVIGGPAYIQVSEMWVG